MNSAIPPLAARVFLGIWLLCHILYPLWFPFSGDLKTAAAIFAGFCALTAAITFYLKSSLAGEDAEERELLADLFHLPLDPVVWGLAALTTLIHLYPLTLPVHYWEGGDEAAHMGIPALPFKVLARHLPFPYPVLAWAAAIGLAPFYRVLFAKVRGFFSDLIAARPAALFLATAAFGAVFAGGFVVLRHFWNTGHPTLIIDILRFPPLCKWIRIPIYALLGVSNLTGRSPEFLFFLASGALLYKMVLDFRTLPLARFAAAAYWFAPPIAYYSMRGSQTQGEMFFYILAAYFYVRWLRDGKAPAIYWAALSVGVGSMYRYTLPVLGALMAGWTAAVVAFDRDRRRNLSWRGAAECLGLMGLLIVPWTASFFLHQLRVPAQRPVLLENFLFGPWQSLIHGMSLPFAVLMALGAALALIRKKDAFQAFLIVWCAGYYAFIGTDMTEVVRLQLPMYPPLILWAGEAIMTMTRGRGLGRWLAGAAAAYLFVISTAKPVDSMEARFAMKHSLDNEYIPLTAAAAELNGMAPGTRLLSIDCSQGCFTLYLKRPKALDWTIADSRKIDSMEALRRICDENKIQVVMYMAGTLEAFQFKMNPDLFAEFERGASWLQPLASYQLGANKVVFKKFIPANNGDN